MFFRYEKGLWWSTYFGSDDTAPWQERPGLLPVTIDANGRIQPQSWTEAGQ
jgi:xylan 1,4-beta-xylosidase